MELIGRDDLAAVSIITPPGAHHALSVAALRAGKHVLCEKPFALDVRQAREMVSAAEQSRRTAMVAHEFRHTPQRAYIKKLLDDGYIGTFRLCTIELFLDRYVTAEPRPFTWIARKADGGGLLGALGSHYIDGLRYWFGEVATVAGTLATLRPDLVDSATGRRVQAETDDTFTMTLTFENGGMATMIASFATTPARGAKITVMGDRGTLIAEQPGPNPLEDGIVVASRDGSALQPLKTPAQYAPFNDPRDHRLMAFRLLVRDFNRGVESGSSPAPNFIDGLRCQEVLDAAHESSASGRTVSLS
jgi:predicted dehydrogenase